MTDSHTDNITPLVQLGMPADIAAAVCSTLYKKSSSLSELDETISILIDEIMAAKGLIK